MLGEHAGGILPEEEAARLVEQVVDYAVIGLDPAGHVRTWNLGAERLKGYERAQAIGLHFSAFYSTEDQEAGLPSRLLARALADGRVHDAGWRLRRDGTRFWGDVTITALHDHDGRHTGFTKVTRDLTAAHSRERDRQAFLATLAHDYRGPIQAISGYAEMLSDAGDRREDFIAKIQSNAARLLQMTESLLELAHSESVEAELHPTSVDVLTVARTAVDTLRTLPGAARVVVAPGSCWVTADAAALERIVDNLVTNALKYSQQGPVEIAAEQHESRVRLTVSDHGRGIHTDDLERIFDPYERGRYAETDDGGLGLGLASVKRLAERQGGAVAIQSPPGGGTVVIVELPAG